MNKDELWRTKTVATPSVVAEFVLDTLELYGAAIDSVDWGVYAILWPPEELKLITFDVEIAQERSDCELVTYGTPFFEKILQVSRSHGTQEVRRLPAGAVKIPGQLDQKLAQLVHLVKCRAPVVHSWRLEEGCAVLYRFHVTYHMADIVEEVLPAFIDAGTLADITDMWSAMEAYEWDAVQSAFPEDGQADGDSPSVLPLRPLHPLQDSYQQAVHVVSARIGERMEALTQEYRAQNQEEVLQSQNYYQSTLDTLQLQLRSTADPAKAERLRLKIEATERDWQHRQEDIARSYEVSADVFLDQSLMFLIPVLRVEAWVQQRAEQLPFAADYYPWAKRWAPIVCSACYRPAAQLLYGHGQWHCGCLS